MHKHGSNNMVCFPKSGLSIIYWPVEYIGRCFCLGVYAYYVRICRHTRHAFPRGSGGIPPGKFNALRWNLRPFSLKSESL